MQIIKQITPAIVTILAILVANIPTHIAGVSNILYPIFLINIYYWRVFLPKSLPYLILFILGVLQDSLRGTNFISSLLIIVCVLLLQSNKIIFRNKSFIMIWIEFALFISSYIVLEWLLMSIYLWKLIPINLQILQIIYGILLYPSLHSILTKIRDKL